MSEEIKSEEVVKEINPIDEYLNNYKEQKLAEFCVQKDKEIEKRKKEKQELVEQIETMRHNIEKYDKYFSSTNELYNKIKEMSVDEYLNLYNKFVDDISNRNASRLTIAPNSIYNRATTYSAIIN